MKHAITILLLTLLFISCRREPQIVLSEEKEIKETHFGKCKGFFLLNEGNMGSNKATLDYMDYETGVYTVNIYPQRNPYVVKELGDVGNDLQIYGNKIYAVINCSNLVEVMDLATAKHIGVISVPNCRYITFDSGYAYVSSYAGPVLIDSKQRLGYVAKIDTSSLQIVDSCTVGYQPEEMAVSQNKLYVANSGGYMVPDYDSTLSVIDLDTFTEIKKIPVAKNLHRVEKDKYGYLYVSSRSDYYELPSETYIINTKTDEPEGTIDDLPNSEMTISGDSLYVCSTTWNYSTGKSTISYAIYDVVKKEIVTRNFIKDSTEKNITTPYGIAVNSTYEEFYITDAYNFVTPGKLHCYSLAGKLKWSVTTGDAPAHFAFTEVKLK